MFPSFSPLIVISLMLLQFIAPLTHAHVGKDITRTGLHVPGLETFSAVNDLPGFETADDYSSSDTVLFGVGAGIKQSQKALWTDVDDSHYLFQSIADIPPPLSAFNTSLSPRSPPVAGVLSMPSHTPRAPPAQP
jgi:hypothetical protein